MSAKKVKRRSNWYIYLITFVITFAVLGLVVLAMWDLIFPEKTAPSFTSSGMLDYRPPVTSNMTVLCMLSNEAGGVPEQYMLINYRARDDVAVIVPLKVNMHVNVGGINGGLSDAYQGGGSEGVAYAIESMIGIKSDYYIKFNKTSFTSFAELVGSTPVNVPYALMEDDEIIFPAGSYDIMGGDLYKYITFENHEGGEDYSLVVQGSAISSFINNNSRNLSSTEIQAYFNKIINSTDTNFTFDDYIDKQSAFNYTTNYSINIAEYYIPFGEHNENGFFIIAEDSVLAIKDRFGMTEDELE